MPRAGRWAGNKLQLKTNPVAGAQATQVERKERCC